MAIFDTAGRDRVTPDPLLSQLSIEFARDVGFNSFIGTRLAPPVRVDLQTGRYRLYGREAFKQPAFGSVRAPGTRANRVEGSFTWAEDTYFASEDALELAVPIEEYENNPDEDVRQESTREVTGQLLVQHEIAVRDLALDTSQYVASHVTTLTAGQHFDEYATSDPITVFRDTFRTFHDSTGIVPNVAVIPWKVMSYLEDHPDIIARYAALAGNITPEQIAEILHLQQIWVPGAQYDTNTNPALTAAIADIWGDNIILAYIPNSPSPRQAAFMYDFMWPIAGGQNQLGEFSLDVRYDDDNIQDLYRVRRRSDLKIVGRDPEIAGPANTVAGALILDVLST